MSQLIWIVIQTPFFFPTCADAEQRAVKKVLSVQCEPVAKECKFRVFRLGFEKGQLEQHYTDYRRHGIPCPFHLIDLD